MRLTGVEMHHIPHRGPSAGPAAAAAPPAQSRPQTCSCAAAFACGCDAHDEGGAS